MQKLIAIIEKWKTIALQKQKEAIKQGDSHESNYQLGKIKICNEFIAQLKREIEEEKETSKEGIEQGTQSNEEDHRQQSNSI